MGYFKDERGRTATLLNSEDGRKETRTKMIHPIRKKTKQEGQVWGDKKMRWVQCCGTPK